LLLTPNAGFISDKNHGMLAKKPGEVQSQAEYGQPIEWKCEGKTYISKAMGATSAHL